jgi:hypothetical protein
MVRWKPSEGSPWGALTVTGSIPSLADPRYLTVHAVEGETPRRWSRGYAYHPYRLHVGACVDTTMAPGTIEVIPLIEDADPGDEDRSER